MNSKYMINQITISDYNIKMISWGVIGTYITLGTNTCEIRLSNHEDVHSVHKRDLVGTFEDTTDDQIDVSNKLRIMDNPHWRNVRILYK